MLIFKKYFWAHFTNGTKANSLVSRTPDGVCCKENKNQNFIATTKTVNNGQLNEEIKSYMSKTIFTRSAFGFTLFSTLTRTRQKTVTCEFWLKGEPMTVLDTCKLNIYVSTKSLVFDLKSLTWWKNWKQGKSLQFGTWAPGGVNLPRQPRRISPTYPFLHGHL